MTQAAQVGESSAQRPSLAFFNDPLPSVEHNSGLLGDQRAQWTVFIVHVGGAIELASWQTWRHRPAITPASKLAVLKQRTFTPQGREERIRRSLAALGAPQPIVLTREQWKEIVEEVEDENEE